LQEAQLLIINYHTS